MPGTRALKSEAKPPVSVEMAATFTWFELTPGDPVAAAQADEPNAADDEDLAVVVVFLTRPRWMRRPLADPRNPRTPRQEPIRRLQSPTIATRVRTFA